MLIIRPLGDAATITVSSQQTALPVTNLQKPQPSDYWMGTSTNSENFVYDLGASTEINFVALLYTNAGDAVTWQIRADDVLANLISSPGFDTGSLTHNVKTGLAALGYGRTHAVYYQTASETHRYWRVDIRDLGGTPYRAGRLYLGKAIDVSAYWQYNWQLDVSDSPQLIETENTLFVRERSRRRIFQLRLDEIDKASAFNTINPLALLRGQTRDLLFVGDHDDTTTLMDTTAYGVVEGSLSNPNFDRFSKTFTVREYELP